MAYVERLRDIETLLVSERKVQVEDLSRRFGVSEVTIRKDLSQLENRGVLLRTHGGAVLAEKPDMVVSLHRRSLEQTREKLAIAREAAGRIQDGESILLDTGSTTLALARELHGRSLNVITNSLTIAVELSADEEMGVIVLGGRLRRSSLALMGAMPLEQLKNLHIDRAFMGASGFDVKAGFSCQNLIEAETKRVMLTTAREAIMLVDYSKFGRAAFAPFCGLDDIQCVITDAPPPMPAAEAMRKLKVELVIAENWEKKHDYQSNRAGTAIVGFRGDAEKQSLVEERKRG